ncbi:MAG: DUF4365 domain-containing protein [Planctomycetia bacterium]|nr:DUF4365 domain-containing protein [Planctomycetia bacterium]
MAFWKPQGPRKRRTREHVIADLSVNHLERCVLLCGWTVQRTTHDYGVDLMMETYNARGEPESGRVLFQLKATDKLKVGTQGRSVTARLDGRDLRAWRTEPMPLILIVYDALADRAYWLHMQPCLAEQQVATRKQPASVTVHLPRDQVVDEAAIRHFARLRDAVLARIQRVLFHDQ